MKYFLVALVIASASMLNAADHGKLGIGYDQGVSVRYGLNDNMAVQAVLNFGMTTVSAAAEEASEIAYGTDDTSATKVTATNIDIQLYYLHCLAKKEKVNLNFFGGIVLSIPAALDKSINFDGDGLDDNKPGITTVIRLGLEPEIFIVKSLSLAPKFGLNIALNGKSGAKQLNDDADGLEDVEDNNTSIGFAGDAISIIGGAAFHFYF